MSSAIAKPKVKLVGEDGNIFAIVGRCGAALKRAGLHEQARELYDKVPACQSYEDALALCCEYVDAS